MGQLGKIYIDNKGLEKVYCRNEYLHLMQRWCYYFWAVREAVVYWSRKEKGGVSNKSRKKRKVHVL